MTLAVCLTVGYNYSAVKETTSLSISLNQLAKVEFAIAEDTQEDECTSEPFEDQGDIDYTGDDGCDGAIWFNDWTECSGNKGECTETDKMYYITCDGQGGVTYDVKRKGDC